MAATITNPIALSKERLADLQEAATERVEKLRQQANQRVEIARGVVLQGGVGVAYATSAAALEGIANLSRFVPFTKNAAAELEKRAESLNEASDALLAPSIEKYDELNVKQVADALEGLDAWELRKVERYETAHKARKTVLSAVARRLI